MNINANNINMFQVRAKKILTTIWCFVNDFRLTNIIGADKIFY
jgi:hypothetical protein